jgi:hypothetical protein
LWILARTDCQTRLVKKVTGETVNAPIWYNFPISWLWQHSPELRLKLFIQ